MVNDPIADFINRLKTAAATRKNVMTVPFSKHLQDIADVLVKEGFLEAAVKRGKKARKYLEVTLKFEQESPLVHGTQRLSRLGKRVYMGVADIKPVKFGHGTMVLSTPKGLLTDKQARKERVGGEALFTIW